LREGDARVLVRGAIRRCEADLRQCVFKAYSFGGASVAVVGFQVPRCALGDCGDDEPTGDVGDPVAVSTSDHEGPGEGEGVRTQRARGRGLGSARVASAA
jgi:hypothetical protein